MSQQTFATGRLKGDITEITLPSSFAEVFTPLSMWPEDVYAGRLTVLGDRLALEQLPRTNP